MFRISEIIIIILIVALLTLVIIKQGNNATNYLVQRDTIENIVRHLPTIIKDKKAQMKIRKDSLI